ncbi:MAG: diacylglycerol kinase family protein [Pseudomonadota bacterium]
MPSPTAPDEPSRAEQRVCLVVNPRAGAGGAGEAIGTLERLAAATFARWEVRCTERPGHAREIASQAAAEGFDLVAAVGGDGTCHEVVNGLMHARTQRRPVPVFTVIPFGTGSDLIRSLGIPNHTGRAVGLARDGVTRTVDVGHVRCGPEEHPLDQRWFINEISFGLGGEVVARVNRSSKVLGGFVTFLGATVSSLVRYRPPRVALSWEGPGGPGEWEGEIFNAFVANGHYCGGGMFVGKDGSMSDGLLDLTVLPPMNLAASAANLPRLYKGTAHEAPGAFRVAVTRVVARSLASDASVPVDADGEQPGVLPVSAQVEPGALRVRGGWREPR